MKITMLTKFIKFSFNWNCMLNIFVNACVCLIEMSSRLGGEQQYQMSGRLGGEQQYQVEEHLYAVCK